MATATQAEASAVIAQVVAAAKAAYDAAGKELRDTDRARLWGALLDEFGVAR